MRTCHTSVPELSSLRKGPTLCLCRKLPFCSFCLQTSGLPLFLVVGHAPHLRSVLLGASSTVLLSKTRSRLYTGPTGEETRGQQENSSAPYKNFPRDFETDQNTTNSQNVRAVGRNLCLGSGPKPLLHRLPVSASQVRKSSLLFSRSGTSLHLSRLSGLSQTNEDPAAPGRNPDVRL